MTGIQIRSFQPEDRDAFRALNEEWISLYFKIEEPDRLVLSDPERHILSHGGHIFMAFDGGRAVGCCALIAHGEPRTFEVAKMAVAPDYRGRGIGRRVLAHTIAEARALGAETLRLESNSVLANAVHLYESLGFVHRPPESIPQSPYKRANVFMELRLIEEATELP